MKIGDAITLAISALREKRLRSILTILMVVVGAALVTSLNGMNAGMNQYINDQLNTLGGNLVIVLPSSAVTRFGPPQELPHTTLNLQTLNVLRSLIGVKDLVPFISDTVDMNSAGLVQSATVMGIDQSKLPLIAPKVAVEEGRVVESFDGQGVVLGHEVAYPPGETRSFAKIGQLITFQYSIQREEAGQQKLEVKTKSFQVRGILAEMGVTQVDQTAFISLSAADQLFEKSGVYNAIYVITQDPSLNDSVEAQIRRVYGANIGITTPRAVAQTINEFTSAFTRFMRNLGIISLLVGAVGIVTTLFTSVTERTKEIGLMKALGFNSRYVMLLFLIESAIIGGIGGSLGLLAGIGGAYALTKFTPFGGLQASQVNPVILPTDMIFVWLASFSLSILAGLYPAWRASRLSPVEAFRKD